MKTASSHLRRNADWRRRLVAEFGREISEKLLAIVLDMEITARTLDLDEAQEAPTLEAGGHDGQAQARSLAAALARYVEPSEPHLFTVLFVDDDSDVRHVVVQMLVEQGFAVLGARDAHAALRVLGERPVDLLFTDIAMPEMDGVELARRAKIMCPGIKVLFVTGYPTRVAERDAPDYGKLLVKPLRRDELLREVEVALGATMPKIRASDETVFCFEGFALDLTRRCLRGENREVELRPQCFELLRCLVENAGRLVSKEEIIQAVWPNVIVTDESLARCVSDLRRALRDHAQQIIKTVPRRGYLLAAPVSRPALDTEPAQSDVVAPPL